MNKQLSLGETYYVKVIKYLKNGIIVRYVNEPSETAFIHISQISEKFVDDVSKFVRLDEQIVAECVETPDFGNQLSLLYLGLTAKYLPDAQPDTESNKVSSLNDISKNKVDNVSQSYNRQENSNKSSLKSLDDMIEASNKVFNDKMKGRSRRPKNRRRKG